MQHRLRKKRQRIFLSNERKKTGATG